MSWPGRRRRAPPLDTLRWWDVYLWLLRTGRKTNPTLAHLTALAAHFGVPPAYFFEDALTEGVADDPAGRTALCDPDVRALAPAAAGLAAPLGALEGQPPGGRRTREPTG